MLSADMTSLVGAMKLALKYSRTLLDAEYHRDMLKAAHVIAVDSKNLLDTLDLGRRLRLYRAAHSSDHADTAHVTLTEAAADVGDQPSV